MAARPESSTFVDPGGLVAFWRREYLEGYVRSGGGGVKWLRGREGSGKTRLLAAVAEAAEALGYAAAHVDAAVVPLGRFDELYRAAMRQVPIERLGQALTRTAAGSIGASDWTPAMGLTVEEHLLRLGRPVAAVQDDLARCLDFVYQSRDVMPPVGAAARRLAMPLLVGGDAARSDALTAANWLRGERLLAPERRRTGIYLAVNRYSARDVLRSLLHLFQLVGMAGMVWTVDGLEGLLATRHLERLAGDAPAVSQAVHYTPLRRLDAYEGMRELIDEAGSLPGLFVVYAGRPEAFDDERAGLATYPALAMRVQTEIEADAINPFNDVQDLDRLWLSDWPRHQRALVDAYGRGEPADSLDLASVLAGTRVSPVRRLVELLTGAGAAEGRESLG